MVRKSRKKTRRNGKKKAARSLATKQFVRRALRQEKEVNHSYVTSVTTQEPGVLYSHTCFVDVSQGTSATSRIGKEIRGIGTRLSFSITNYNTANWFKLRVLCCEVLDDPTTTALLQFFEPTSSGTALSFGSNADTTRLVRSINKRKFRVLHDKTYSFAEHTAGNRYYNHRDVRGKVVKINRDIKFDGPATGAGQQKPLFKWFWFWENEANDVLQTIDNNMFIYDYYTD